MSKQMMPKKTLRLRKRAEFLAVREGEKRRGPLFMLEVKLRSAETSLAAKIGETPRVGITVTKKNGNAVIRNRIRRRLKEVVRCHTAGDMAASTDYVIVARKEVLNTPFLKLARELAQRVTRKADKSSADKNRRNDRPESGPVNGKKS